jgi:hypothetical protein
LLSASWSPAFAPWGIPEELDCEADVLEVDVLEAAGAEDELPDDEDEPPPPHPASASIAATSAAGISRRNFVSMIVPFT